MAMVLRHVRAAPTATICCYSVREWPILSVYTFDKYLTISILMYEPHSAIYTSLYTSSSICMRPGSDDTVPGKGYTLNEPLIGYCGYISGNDCCPRCYLYILAAAIRSILYCSLVCQH